MLPTSDEENKYNSKNIESKWQELWAKNNCFAVSEDNLKEKYYVLEMFPYPSGKIHMGHVRNYSIGDVLARFYALQGKTVLHPIGWDSFGLPAENAAIERGAHPAKWTHSNIENMNNQFKRLGLSYDWSREIATCKPDYYRWNQWIFTRMLEKGLAYKKKATVNWCVSCSTVLANEQVEDGQCWRCDSVVEQKGLNQWFYKITDYAEELLEGTEKLTGWPDRVLTMQKNWIGKSVGAKVLFNLDVEKDDKVSGENTRSVEVFTTRPDTLYGVTFMSLAPDHPMVDQLTTDDNKDKMTEFVEKFKKDRASDVQVGEDAKEGVFTGSYAVNPLTGDEVPIYAANFVLMDYGTGAVMAVPAHDQRDFEFAVEYDIPMKLVIDNPDEPIELSEMTEAFVDDGVMVNSGEFTGRGNREAMGAIIDHLEKNNFGTKTTNYRLRDWGISRQRYWGTPIPVIYCDDCGTVPVPDSDLPITLPEDIKLTGHGLSALAECDEFVNADCPKCGKAGKRETDTMDTFVDSSWYFFRYTDPKNTELPFDKNKADTLLPVDRYIGGIEHAVMHLLYARFFTKVLRDLGLTKVSEPFKNLLTQGMVCMETVKCPEHGFLAPEDFKDDKCLKCSATIIIGPKEKMSKSKKNVVDPDHIIDKYGSDTTRLFSLFAAPPEKDLDWNEDGVEGSARFIGRVWRLVTDNLEVLKTTIPYNPSEDSGKLSGAEKDLHHMTHVTIKRVTEDTERRLQFNTAISAIMEFVNSLYQFKVNADGSEGINNRVFKEAVDTLVVLLNPFAPHVTEELWSLMGKSVMIAGSQWPKLNEASLKTDEIEVVVQVNGKVRSKISVSAGASKEEVEESALNDEKVKEWVEGKEVKKIIYVPGKLVSIVIKG